MLLLNIYYIILVRNHIYTYWWHFLVCNDIYLWKIFIFIYSYLITIFLLLYILVSIISLLHDLLTTRNINFTKYKIIDKINLSILHLYLIRFVFIYLIRLVFIYIYDKIHICFLWNSGGEHPHLLSLIELLASSKTWGSTVLQLSTTLERRRELRTPPQQHNTNNSSCKSIHHKTHT
jgi:hypothetical protein